MIYTVPVVYSQDAKFNADAHFSGDTTYEGNATFGKNVEVDGKLTLNSADDLVDKDGNDLITAQSIDTSKFVTTDTEQTISGTKTFAQDTELRFAYSNYYCAIKYRAIDGRFPSFSILGNDNIHEWYFNSRPGNGSFGIYDTTGNTVVMSMGHLESSDQNYVFSDKYGRIIIPNTSGTFALTSDIPTYYRHTISITGGTTQSPIKAYFTLVDKNSANITADNLYTRLSGESIAVSGIYGSGTQLNILTIINFGSDAANTTVSMISVADSSADDVKLSELGTIAVSDDSIKIA